MEAGAPGALAQSNTPVKDLQQSTSQFKIDDKDERHQQKQEIMDGRHRQRRENYSSQQEQFEQNQPKHPEQRQQHVDERRTSAESNSFALHFQQEGENQRYWSKDKKHEQQQEQKKEQMTAELQQQQEGHSNQQEPFQQSQTQHSEQGQPSCDGNSYHLWPETLHFQQQQQKEEQEQRQHEEKQQYMQKSLQTHRQLQEQQLQPQVQQQKFFHQQSLQAAASGDEQHQELKKEQMKGEMQQKQNQREDHSNPQELFQQSQTQHPEQGQPQCSEQSNNIWLKTLQLEQQQQKEEQVQHEHEEKHQYMQQSLETHQHLQQQQLQPQMQQQQFNHQQSLQAETSGHEQQQEQKNQQMKGELQHQKNQEEDYSDQQELFQQSRTQHQEQGQSLSNERSDNLWPETLQVQRQKQKGGDEQHQHEEKQQFMQQSLQIHQQSEQQQLQHQVQQYDHQESPQAAANGQNTSGSISFSYLVEMILPHLSQEKAECVSARLLKFRRNEITKDDFVSSTRKAVGDQILVQMVDQIQKKATLATSSTATLHHTLYAFGEPISGCHSSGNLLEGQRCIQMPSAPPSSAVGSQINTSANVPLSGQDNCYEAGCPSNQQPRKKQKVSRDLLDQRIDPLNDVTAVSGINLREEEENLFAGCKDESRVSEARRNAVQIEERIFLEKGPLHAKLAGIMKKNGIKYISTDSEHCLSLCIEEHLRAVIGQLIRLSKQRVDLERIRHKVFLTSDLQHQILELNKKVKEDLEMKQAEEEEKLQALYKTAMTKNHASTMVEKNDNHAKIQRAYKDCNEMRSNAANAAVRAAIGGDDVLLKWQLMAEQARQKHKAIKSCTNGDVSRRIMAGSLEAGNVVVRSDAPSTGREYPSSWCTQTEPVHTICVKDVIALLERIPHMTKSTLLYRLYEREAGCSKEQSFGNQNNDDPSQ